MDDYQKTFQTWNQLADWYEENITPLDIYDRSYMLFCEKFSAKSPSILELGCGPGNITKQLHQINPNFKIMATDISENMLAVAKKNNPNCNFQKIDIRAIASIKQKFDGLVAGFCLPYLSKEDTHQLIQNAQQLLNPNGVLYLSCIEGDYEKSGLITNGMGQQSLMFYYDEEFLSSELKAHDFKDIIVERISYPNVKEPTARHLVFIAIKGN